MTLRRLGFAYNPTIEDAIELRERAAGWCRMRGDRALGRPGRRDREPGRAAATARTC